MPDDPRMFHLPAADGHALCGVFPARVTARVPWDSVPCRACRLAAGSPMVPLFHARRDGTTTMYCGLTAQEADAYGEAWSIPRYYGFREAFEAVLTCEPCYTQFHAEHCAYA